MRSLSLVALALVAACSKDAATTAIVVRDSAGVQIIEHPASAIAATPGWTLGPATATIRHGAGEEEIFTRIPEATRLSDGRIVVIDAEENGAQPYLYGADGTFERKLGGMGQGPGEFKSAALLGCGMGDTLCIFDFNSRRITMMTPEGTVTSTVDLSRVGQMALGFPRGILPGGRLVSMPFVFDTVSKGDGVFRTPNAIVVLDPTSQQLDTVASDVPGGAMYIGAMAFGGRSMSFPMPAGYGAQPLILTLNGQIVVAANENADIVSYSLPWAARRIVRFDRAAVPIGAAARQAFIDGSIREIQGSTAPNLAAFKDQMLERVKETKFADSMAYYANVRSGTDGSLWLMEMQSQADSTPRFLVLDPQGRLVGRATIPNAARLLWASDTEVLILLRDEDDVPHVELRPIVKGTPAA